VGRSYQEPFIDTHLPAIVAPALTNLIFDNIMLAADSEHLDWLPELPKLRRLVLTEVKTRSSQLPHGIAACSNLTQLQLECMLVNFFNLNVNQDDRHGDWPECRLRTLPAGPYLSQLVRLSLTWNAFDAVPPAVAAVTALQHLDLGEQLLQNFSRDPDREDELLICNWQAGPVLGLNVLNSLTRLKSITFRNNVYAGAEAAICEYRAANANVDIIQKGFDTS